MIGMLGGAIIAASSLEVLKSKSDMSRLATPSEDQSLLKALPSSATNCYECRVSRAITDHWVLDGSFTCVSAKHTGREQLSG